MLIAIATILLVFVISPSYYKSSEASLVRYETKGLTENIQRIEDRGHQASQAPNKMHDVMRNTKPRLKMGFLHMRKSGGTHINHILSEFMYEHGCMLTGKDVVVEQKVGVRGIRGGVPLDMIDPKFHLNYTKHPLKCPDINYIHEEMMSFHGMYYLQMNVPVRGKRKDKAFSLFTTIRDPIERIGSQAFYGKFSVARTTVNDVIRNSNDSMCDYYLKLQKTKQGFNPIAEAEICSAKNTGTRLVACNCFNKAMNETKEIIRTNETVWFNWIKNVVGYQDEYMPNYFVKRLVATTSGAKYPKMFSRQFNHSRYCIITGNCTNEDQYDILSGIFQTTPGVGYDRSHSDDEQEYDVNIALNISKALLRNHFDFIIMDYFSEPRSTIALSRALHSSLYLSDRMKENDNSGVFNPVSPNTTHAREYAQKVMLRESRMTSLSAKPNTTIEAKPNDIKLPQRRLSDIPLRSEHGKTESVPIIPSRRRLSTTYRREMPQSVLRYLEKDNAADIQLYKFALEEFERRSEAELWTHSHYYSTNQDNKRNTR